MSVVKLNEIKNEVEKILDNHLEENQKISIQDLDEESTFLLIDLLLEKDDTKREETWDMLHKKILNEEQSIELDLNEILKIKDLLYTEKFNIQSIRDLKNMILLDKTLDDSLNIL